MAGFRVYNAQNREDIILSGFFTKVEKGFYVDVGANHPDTLSVTKYFYDRGWHGINIEPNRKLFQEIERQRPNDNNLNIGVADKPGELVLREYPEGDGLSTFSTETQSSYQQKSSEYRKYTQIYEDHRVAVKPLKQILKECEVDAINFMNIDVEGFEYQVIAGNDWQKYRPQVICIEANHIVRDWRPVLEKNEYKLVFFDGLNNYYVAREHPDIIAGFSYVNTMLLGEPIIPAYAHRLLNDTRTQLDHAKNQVTQLELREQNNRAEIRELHARLRANGRLRSLVKQLVSSANGVVLLQIEKLNRPRRARRVPLAVEPSMTVPEMLSEIKRYDATQYYNGGAAHPWLYRCLNTTYRAAYRLTKNAARKIGRLVGSGI